MNRMYRTKAHDSLNNFDETDREYSLVTADDLIRFWRSKVRMTADLIYRHVMTASSLGCQNPYSSYTFH